MSIKPHMYTPEPNGAAKVVAYGHLPGKPIHMTLNEIFIGQRIIWQVLSPKECKTFDTCKDALTYIAAACKQRMKDLDEGAK